MHQICFCSFLLCSFQFWSFQIILFLSLCLLAEAEALGMELGAEAPCAGSYMCLLNYAAFF